ncbi:MAG: 1-acyl-sn-glycerol-3-phosphate acyltransferase [Gammaproteobacteria bacterium]|nr:1-acyl-sn-glycerol-3-phosphate acyltransferase [Gammaproteobacteria bacterium]
MPVYVMLMRYHSAGLRAVREDPQALLAVHDTLKRWESKVLESYRLIGEWDQCTVFEAPDNFKAYRATLEQEISVTADTEILPAIDYNLFSRLVTSESGTVGPHHWQVRWWAKVARLGFRWHAYDRWVHRYFKPFTVLGREKFRGIKGPCIIVANHTSHMDAVALHAALPGRIRWNVYAGAAADRWFVKGRKELVMQPWYQSLAMGTFPIQRGGGSKALDYPKWLLDQGCNLIIFPEGTRSTSRSMAKFRHGVSILALEKDVPVVPVFLAGLSAIRPKGTREPQPGPAYVRVLEPIRFAPGTSVPDATRQIFEAMNAVHRHVAQFGDAALVEELPGPSTALSSQASRS